MGDRGGEVSIATLTHLDLPTGDMVHLTPDPCILTSVVVADTAGQNWGATVTVANYDGWEGFLQVGAGLRGTGMWTGRIFCPLGIDLWGQAGGTTIPVTVGLE